MATIRPGRRFTGTKAGVWRDQAVVSDPFFLAGSNASGRIDQAFAQGVSDQLGRGMHTGFAHHTGAVAVHGLHANAQSLANLAIGPAGYDQIENLPFPVGQRLKVSAVFQQFGVPAADYTAAIEDARQGPGQLVYIVGFAEYPVCTDFDEFRDLAECFDSGENNDASIR